MNTRFELVLHGSNPVALRAAGEEALEEIRRLEARLSIFRPESELAHVNARAAREPVRVSAEVFSFLERARALSTASGGAFDPTVGPLLRCWGLLGAGPARVPDAAELAAARRAVGMELVELDAAAFTVRFRHPEVQLDPGAIGKGFAVEQAIMLLREAGVASALLHGGTSSAAAIGTPPDGEAWQVAVELPPHLRKPGEPPLAVASLRNEAMSVSAVWGKGFSAGGRTLGHVMDPRTGQPAQGAVLSAVVLPSATETDALSTALLVAGEPGIEGLSNLRPGARSLVAWLEGGELRARSAGIPLARGQARTG